MKLFYFAAAIMAAPALGDPIPQLTRAQSSTVKPVIKPYIPDYDISDVCFPGEREGCMGSRMYCIRSGWKSEGEPKKYSSPAECHSERVTKEGTPNAPPGGKIPFLEASGIDCGHIGNPEFCTGSASFCAASTDEAACLAARTSPPGNLTFHVPAGCKLMTEECIGTKKWCRMDPKPEECEQRRA
ncbi:hypothetical protein IF1G_11413 [Cordyceps javanica]|uniref:Uncharacterized protein n=1 Tax=Cordyceps javanica TaxID=43265 RepID=A0A545UKD7_9HYPO|nr:hypothetical protein IF1G_11413 [Cordyceps javanica]